LWCILNLCISIVDCIESTFGDNGGQHGQESEESEEGEENSEEEKEVTVRRKLHGIRIASEASCASQHGQVAASALRISAWQSDRIAMQMVAA
jgi:hypothetical protein